MPGLVIGKFKVLSTLGSGAHSTIFHVRREADSTQYALKIVKITNADQTKFVEQAEHEFRIAQMLNHPNLIKILALERQRDWLFRTRKLHLLLEYVNGRTLDTVPALALPRIVLLFGHVASGLAHMHRRNVFHADLKPNNVLLSKVGEVKIIDYGLAWVRGQDKGGRVQGTPEYMAPETANESVVSEASDIYNFGATLYRMLTFRLPPSAVRKPGGIAVNAKTWKQLIRPVSECNAAVPPKLCELTERCLEYEPRRRPECMTLIRDELTELAKTLVKRPEDRLEAIEW
jgi:eukaryotic-like serine/threonine-protein kinase